MYSRDPKDIKQAYKVRGNIAKIGKQYELYNCLIDIEDQLIAPSLPQEYAGKSQGRNGGGRLLVFESDSRVPEYFILTMASRFSPQSLVPTPSI